MANFVHFQNTNGTQIKVNQIIVIVTFVTKLRTT